MSYTPEALRRTPIAEWLAERLEDPVDTHGYRLVANNAAAELRRLHAENETLRRLLQTAVDFDEACRLPDWKIPQWVIESMAELARAEGSQT